MKNSQATKGHVEPQINGTSSAQLKEELNTNNDVYAQAIAEHQAEQKKKSKQEAFQKRFGSETHAAGPSIQAPKKKRIYELSISDNVTNGEGMVDVLISFGSAFNPVNVTYTITSLQALNLEARGYLTEVMQTKSDEAEAISQRRALYEAFPFLITRIINELEACGAPRGTIKAAKHWVDKTRGKRIGNQKEVKPGSKQISTAQTSFPLQVDHFSELLIILEGCRLYDSNQPDLKLAALKDFRDSMIAANSAASLSNAFAGTSRVSRNEFFNEDYTGFVAIYAGVKRAVKATFGGNSPQYHQVAKFQFKRIYE